MYIMDFFIIFRQMLVLILLVGTGFFLSKKHILDSDSSSFLSRLIVDICSPALVISCTTSENVQLSTSDLLTVFFVAIAVYLLLIAIGSVLPKLFHIPEVEGKNYTLMTVYGNIGFIGIPVAQALFNNTMVFYITSVC